MLIDSEIVQEIKTLSDDHMSDNDVNFESVSNSDLSEENVEECIQTSDWKRVDELPLLLW